MLDENRKRAMRAWLGRTVTVEIDRPLGCTHNGTVYPINYGYLPGTLAADGEEQDVYLLGVAEPVKHCTAHIIGIIYRENDSEDKLVAAPIGQTFTASEIAKAVHFQEQYFKTSVESLD